MNSVSISTWNPRILSSSLPPRPQPFLPVSHERVSQLLWPCLGSGSPRGRVQGGGETLQSWLRHTPAFLLIWVPSNLLLVGLPLLLQVTERREESEDLLMPSCLHLESFPPADILLPARVLLGILRRHPTVGPHLAPICPNVVGVHTWRS